MSDIERYIFCVIETGTENFIAYKSRNVWIYFFYICENYKSPLQMNSTLVNECINLIKRDTIYTRNERTTKCEKPIYYMYTNMAQNII